MYISMRWQNERPGIFVICKGELPEIKNYPICLEEADGTIKIKRYCYTEIKGLKPFKEGLQTGFLREENVELEIKVQYLPIKLTGVSLNRSGRSNYRAGDKFEPDGYALRAHYSDGHEKEITDFLCPTSELKAGQTAVTLSYGCKFCKASVTVSNNSVMTSPAVSVIGFHEDKGNNMAAGPLRVCTRSVHRTWRFCPFYPSRSDLGEEDRAERSIY